MMQIDACQPQQLSERDLAAWRSAVADGLHLGSPFFHPDYVLALAEFRPQVEVAVVRQQGEPVGWLPFERHGTIGKPLGIKLADFQGAIFRAGCEIPLDQIVSQIGLRVWNYDYLLAEQACERGRLEIAHSPWIDLSDGYDAYIARQRAGDSVLVAQTQRKQRKLKRNGHEVEFRWHDDDPEALQRLWVWKSAQRLATGTMDILQFDWVRRFLERIAGTEVAGFRGIVSTLRVDGEIAAVHLGMHTATTHHYWFPAYSLTWGTYSPGLILLLSTAEECARRGIKRIDLGKGDDNYKLGLCSDVTPVATGAIDHSSVRRLLRTSLSSTRQWIKQSPLRTAAKWPVRWWRRWRTQTAMGGKFIMNYRCCKADALSTADWAAWTALVDSEPTLDSPFFRPEFTRHVVAVRSDVSVGVLEDGGAPVGFFPFQRCGRSVQPVVGWLSECHGMIAAAETKWNPVELLTACGIETWHFDHLPDTQTVFCEIAWGSTPSPYLDLSGGYEAYRAALRASGSSFAEAERKGRKLAREVGPLRFVWHDESPATLKRLIEWKSAQHRRTNMLEIFQHQWLCDLLANLQRSQSPNFSAPVSALYAGERLVAVHLGLVTRTMLHWWFPTYDTEFEKYSPGLTLLLNVAEQAAARGLQRIELGPGESRYKDNFKSGDRPMFEGLVGRDPFIVAARSAWYHMKRRIRQSKYRAQLEAPLTATRHLRQWLAFR